MFFTYFSLRQSRYWHVLSCGGLGSFFSSLNQCHYIILLKGEEICVALQTHINDVMLRRYSKARSTVGGSLNEDTSTNFKPSNMELYEKRVQDLSKLVEESQTNADQVSLSF